MYKNIKIKNFRAFGELSATDLSRVNLLVGKNNSGKTSFLEAIEILAANGRPLALLRGPRRRYERPIEATTERRSSTPDVRHLFYGHDLRPGNSFEISGSTWGGSGSFVRCDIRSSTRLPEVDLLGPDTAAPTEALDLVVSGPEGEEEAIQISQDGSAIEVNRPATSPHLQNSRASFTPTIYLGTDGADPYTLHALWDKIVLTEEEEQVIAAIKIIEPSIERVAFVGRERSSTLTALVKVSDYEQRLPIGNFGEGTTRILGMAILAVRAGGGVLLVDEIDTGLHYTAMEAMWRFIVETAIRLDIQVFATTHSNDCVRALAYLHQEHQDLAEMVSLHRIERGRTFATRYTTAELEVAVRHGIEVRG